MGPPRPENHKQYPNPPHRSAEKDGKHSKSLTSLLMTRSQEQRDEPSQGSSREELHGTHQPEKDKMAPKLLHRPAEKNKINPILRAFPFANRIGDQHDDSPRAISREALERQITTADNERTQDRLREDGTVETRDFALGLLNGKPVKK